MEKNILIIDDDVTALDIIAFLFERKGYTVERCPDGKSAIEYVKHTTPDLLLVDLLMPEMGGVETVKRIRAMGVEHAPVIAFTAVDDEVLHQEAIDAGCNEVLTKPCPSEKLTRVIQRYIDIGTSH